jgi:dipeptidase
LLAVGGARGDAYLPENLDPQLYNWTETPSIGSIPEAAETYAYIDGAYGIINEHQVAIGESTCPARFYSKPRSQGGEALLDVAELSRLALQRTKTAREAIQLMGDLAVEYGYYGAEWEGDMVYDEAGEALTVTDTKEAWMFHILPDDTGKSAIWAAQRVPDDHMTGIGNQFVIHEMDLSDTDYFMASANVQEVAVRNQLWSPEDNVPFDFARAYAKPRIGDHVYYSTRRVWRLFTLANPDLDLSPFTDTYASDYPFSVKPAAPLSPRDIMRFQRDHYEGTPFDMTKGPQGGPFGDPDRYDEATGENLTEADLATGHFERAISIFRASYSFVSVLDAENSDNGFLWFGQYAPHATTYAPVFTKATQVPAHYTRGSLFSFDDQSSFWIHALVGNWASRYYTYAHPFVAKAQDEVEDLAEHQQPDILAHAAKLKRDNGEDAMVDFLTSQSTEYAAQAHKASTDLFYYLVAAFHDGYQVSNFDAAVLSVKSLFYPKWWLELVRFFPASEPATTAPEPVADASAASASALADNSASASSSISSSASASASASKEAAPVVVETPPKSSGVSYGITVLIAAISGSLGVFIGRVWRNPFARTGYRPLQ